MFTRIRTSGLAGGGALLLVLSLSGVVSGATLLADTAPDAVDTTQTWEDTDGNGIDDDCQTTVVANGDDETTANTAVDTNLDGVVSTSEAAQSDRVGGTNCNHGGYVSVVANAADDAEEPAAEEEEEAPAEDDAATECVAVPAPTPDPAFTDEAFAFGAWMSTVAQSDAVGGTNCNHGGAVSEAAKAAKEARDAAKAVAKAERQLAKDARAAERAAAKAERDAARAERKAANAAKHAN